MRFFTVSMCLYIAGMALVIDSGGNLLLFTFIYWPLSIVASYLKQEDE